jgi:hypothetical protein
MPRNLPVTYPDGTKGTVRLTAATRAGWVMLGCPICGRHVTVREGSEASCDGNRTHTAVEMRRA